MFDRNALDVNTISECIITLIEQTACHSCWRREGARVRCACGIPKCVSCGPCSLCMCDPKPDVFLTSRLRNINQLLYVYTNTFETDVHTRLETLMRLKLEKTLFPECIQAPAKYHNKHNTEFGINANSRRNTLQHFEKRLSHEEADVHSENQGVSSKLGDSLAHVRKWLDTNAKMTGMKSKTKQRRPLTEINENSRPAKQKSVPLPNSTIANISQKRRLESSDSRIYEKRSKLDEILPFVKDTVDEHTVRYSNNNQNHLNYPNQPAPSAGAQFLVTAEIHSPPLTRTAKCRNGDGGGGGGGGGAGSGRSTGSSDKENRDPNLGVRRGRGDEGGDDDDPASRKRRRPLRQIVRSRLGITSKQS